MQADAIITKILDSLLEATGIDPSAVWPENRLVEDLEMTPSQIDAFFTATARNINLPISFQFPAASGLTLRELVKQIKASQNDGLKSAA